MQSRHGPGLIDPWPGSCGYPATNRGLPRTVFKDTSGIRSIPVVPWFRFQSILSRSFCHRRGRTPASGPSGIQRTSRLREFEWHCRSGKSAIWLRDVRFGAASGQGTATPVARGAAGGCRRDGLGLGFRWLPKAVAQLLPSRYSMREGKAHVGVPSSWSESRGAMKADTAHGLQSDQPDRSTILHPELDHRGNRLSEVAVDFAADGQDLRAENRASPEIRSMYPPRRGAVVLLASGLGPPQASQTRSNANAGRVQHQERPLRSRTKAMNGITGSGAGRRVARFCPCLRHVPRADSDSTLRSARPDPAVPHVDRRFCQCYRESRGQQRGRFGFRRFESDRDDPGPHSGTFGAWFEDNVETLLARMPGRSRRARSIDNRCAPLPIGSCRFLHAVTSPNCHRVRQAAASRPLSSSMETGRRQRSFLLLTSPRRGNARRPMRPPRAGKAAPSADAARNARTAGP